MTTRREFACSCKAEGKTSWRRRLDLDRWVWLFTSRDGSGRKGIPGEEIENRQLLFGAGRAVGASGFLWDCDWCAVGKCPVQGAEWTTRSQHLVAMGPTRVWSQILTTSCGTCTWRFAHSRSVHVVMADRPEEGRTRFGVGLILGFSPDHAT